jgi:hypothetical protein
MKIIINNTVGRKARSALLDLYVAPKYDEQLVAQSISAVLDCLKEGGQ